MTAVSPPEISGGELPVINGREVVATINDEPITLDEFNNTLRSIHGGMTEESRAARIDYRKILDRLISTKLIVLEGKNIGLHELPEVKSQVESYSRRTLVGILRGNYVKNIHVDEKEAERLYREAIKEYKLNSLLFEKESEAEKALEEIKESGSFQTVANRAISEELAKGAGAGEYIKGKNLTPRVVEAINKMEIGDLSDVLKIKQGYVIFKLEDIRFPEDPGVREQVIEKALEFKRDQALEKYKQSLLDKYVTINEDLIAGLDYESSLEDFEKLLNDSRIIAEIKGDETVTVADLTKALKDKYFHGVKIAIRDKKLNAKKRVYLIDNILQQKVFLKEALKQGIDETAAFKNIVGKHEDSLVFDSFMKKVIIPDMELDDEELMTYYNEHIENYSYPSMVKLDSLAFRKKYDAQAALDNLEGGTDFDWLSINAEGLLGKDVEDALRFGSKFFVVRELPDSIQRAVAEAEENKYILYDSPDDDYYYIVHVKDRLPSRPLPFEDVKEQITQKVLARKLQDAIDDWAGKLKEYYDVKVYATEF